MTRQFQDAKKSQFAPPMSFSLLLSSLFRLSKAIEAEEIFAKDEKSTKLK
jgi:hypothetical protein